jgi:hypothetical protein
MPLPRATTAEPERALAVIEPRSRALESYATTGLACVASQVMLTEAVSS